VSGVHTLQWTIIAPAHVGPQSHNATSMNHSGLETRRRINTNMFMLYWY